ncbi:MAG TPA: LytTR family DNA-binding domain-containing protein [Mucilaginibacter sp.]|jgi:DNA-binding LytR/AlgR family response regulator
MEDIARIEDMAEGLNCCLFAVSKTYLTIKEIERHLPQQRFARIHRSFIVNINAVKIIERAQIKLENGISLAMGDHYKQKFLDMMDSRLVKSDRSS